MSDNSNAKRAIITLAALLAGRFIFVANADAQTLHEDAFANRLSRLHDALAAKTSAFKGEAVPLGENGATLRLDGHVAWDAWDSWNAWNNWDAWNNWNAWDAWNTWDSWNAWDAWDAWSNF